MGQPNRLLLTDVEKLVNLKVQRTDWALLGKPWGALSFWAVGRAPFDVVLLVYWLVRRLRRLPRLIETRKLSFCVVTHPLSKFWGFGL